MKIIRELSHNIAHDLLINIIKCIDNHDTCSGKWYVFYRFQEVKDSNICISLGEDLFEYYPLLIEFWKLQKWKQSDVLYKLANHMEQYLRERAKEIAMEARMEDIDVNK